MGVRNHNQDQSGVRISFSVSWGLIGLVIAASLLVFLFAVLPTRRDLLRFVLAVLATGGGVVGAYYVGRGLRLNAESQKTTRTFEFPTRWGDPTWVQTRASVIDLLKELQNKAEDERLALTEKAIAEKPGLEADIRAILNFLEQVALSVNLGLVDVDIIDRLYRTMVVRTYGALAPWVNKERDERDARRIWVEIERLYGEWEQA
jgi:hypothetical protein